MRFVAGGNEEGRRLDRVLRKYLSGASLSMVYRIIRKDVLINGKRASGELLLKQGDAIEILLPEEQLKELEKKQRDKAVTAKRQFDIIYEDDHVLVVDKPYGLLTHGDAVEKKNTLANQVIGYLLEKGVYIPGRNIVFTPAPANRLDRNTTGIVLFGKDLPAAQSLAAMMSGSAGGSIYTEKVYLTIVKGEMKTPLKLRARMVRDDDRNVTRILPEDAEEGRAMVTEVKPIAAGKGYTLVEAKLLTGRTHQIRVQLAGEGFPVVGDRKYGDETANRLMKAEYGLTSHLLHAERLTVLKGSGSLEYLKQKTFRAKPPRRFSEIAEGLGCKKG